MDVDMVRAVDAEGGRAEDPERYSVPLGFFHNLERFTDKIDLLCHRMVYFLVLRK
jgi:hypothetical protein